MNSALYRIGYEKSGSLSGSPNWNYSGSLSGSLSRSVSRSTSRSLVSSRNKSWSWGSGGLKKSETLSASVSYSRTGGKCGS
jgi:hypothetical protein